MSGDPDNESGFDRLGDKQNWFGTSKLEDRQKTFSCQNLLAAVTSLTLGVSSLQFTQSDKEKEIAISTDASDPENDPLVYVYNVSAGRILGTGEKVTWALKGVLAGTYTITAGVDDGCGLCGATITKTVTIQ